MVVMATGVDKG